MSRFTLDRWFSKLGVVCVLLGAVMAGTPAGLWGEAGRIESGASAIAACCDGAGKGESCDPTEARGFIRWRCGATSTGSGGVFEF